jgi:23S rRNA (pseudouridine1915-N3)-methyltransferase
VEIQLWWIGKTAFPYLKEGIQDYEKRLSHLTKFRIVEFQSVRAVKDPVQLQAEEEERFARQIKPDDLIILCDENGDKMSSQELAVYIEQNQNLHRGKMIFIIGGAYGFSDGFKKKCHKSISFSRMTFSHQLFRLIFAEQLYRAFTIIKKIPYHHD